MDTKQVIELLYKYRSGTCSPEEKAFLESWYLHYAKNSENTFSADRVEQILNEVELKIPPNYTPWVLQPIVVRRIVAAAIVLIICAFGFYQIAENKHEVIVEQKVEILPGGNKAILILADGSRIDLKDAANGLLATEGNMKIVKTSDGSVSYENSSILTEIYQNEKAINKIITPKGGTYKITLPDGSEVWLNSASSLSYPIAFTGNQRKVELHGEAYFEIVADKLRPFQVKSDNQMVEVLGTHFNINTYGNSGFVKTTLVEGSVRVTQNYSNGKPYKTQLLKPGQQSIISWLKPEIKIEEVDVEKEVAWKNGYFKFKNTRIQDVMNEIERWYDVEVQYEGRTPSDEFTGFISRDIEISKILNILEEGGGFQFTVMEKKIIVKSI